MTETPTETSPEHWEKLAQQIEVRDRDAAVELLAELPQEERRHAVARLSHGNRRQLLELLPTEEAARLLEDLPEPMVTDLISCAEPGTAAAIVDSLPDSVGAAILRELEQEDSDAVLAEFPDTEDAEHVRELKEFPWDSAGGLMTESFASFQEEATVGGILSTLSEEAERFSDMDVQYVYITSADGHLRGVLRLRNLVLTPRSRTARDIMIPEPFRVHALDDLEVLRKVFDERAYVGLPVVDENDRLIGVVTRQAVLDASAEHQTVDYLSASGIIGGEELRSMKLQHRCLRRLAWLAPNLILNLIAASVISRYEETLQAVIALAVFLPIISDMSGCSGNQSVAVSMRELTLGVIRPTEFLRVVWGEGFLGIINGLVLGSLLGTIAGLWKANLWLGIVVGGALAMNTVVAVLLGGLVPLALKRLKVDPALASGPILTTVTDMCGFFLVLNIASMLLSRLV